MLDARLKDLQYTIEQNNKEERSLKSDFHELFTVYGWNLFVGFMLHVLQ
jgi:hypothetical protein